MASPVAKVADAPRPGPERVVAGQPYTFQENARRFVKRSWLACTISVLLLGAAIAVLSLVRRQLDLLLYVTKGNVVAWTWVCFLTSNGDYWGCGYGYALGAIGLFLSIAVVVMQCIELSDTVTTGYHMCEAVMDAIGAVWWLIGAIILTIQDSQADAAGVGQGSYRNGVVALCWVSFALFLLLALVQLNMAVTMWREYIQRGNRDRGVRKEIGRVSVEDFDRQLPPEPV